MTEPSSPPVPELPGSSSEIQLIGDGDGLAVIGEPGAVERFLTSEGLPSRDLGLHRIGASLNTAAGGLQAASQLAANSGRWVKMTEESAQLVKKYGLMRHNDTGLDLGVVYAKGQPDGIKALVKFEPGSLASSLTSPAILAGAAGIMAQVAMQQTMDEIIDYLATIDEKVDDILRSQKDAVLADMIGVDLVIAEAMTIREQVGRVSEVTWSKVQATSLTIARTQSYALRQLDALAEKLERRTDVGDLARTSGEASTAAQEWLAVLAECFRLQDAIAVLELDRVLDASPEELDRHRLGLRSARHQRLQLIARCTAQLLARMESSVGMANTWVLLHPIASPSVVRSSNQVAAGVHDFRTRLGIESGSRSWEERHWVEAAAEVRDKALETGAEGVRRGGQTLGRATDAFRAVDLDGDGIPDKPRAKAAVEDAGAAIHGAATGVAGAVGSLFRRRRDDPALSNPNESLPDEG